MTKSSKRKTGIASTGPPSALDELLAAEHDIADGDAAAADEVHELQNAARTDVATRQQDAAAALELALAEIDARALEAQAAAVAEIESDAARAAARYRSLTSAEIARLATLVCDRVMGLGAERVT